MGPTVNWHLSPNKYHIVCAEKKWLLAYPREGWLASKLCHCPSEEKVNQLHVKGEREDKKIVVYCSREGSYTLLVS